MENEYVDISKIPPSGRHKGRWPWAEWEKIPPGKALEVTHLLNGMTAKKFSANNPTARKYDLVLFCRKDRVWVARLT